MAIVTFYNCDPSAIKWAVENCNEYSAVMMYFHQSLRMYL